MVNNQRPISPQELQHRSWTQAAAFAFFILPGAAESVREQVDRALADLKYPQSVLEQVRIGLLRALLVFAANISEEDPYSMTQAEVKLRIYCAQVGTPFADGSFPSSMSWGFFIVQKRTYPPDLCALFLDVFLYQE